MRGNWIWFYVGCSMLVPLLLQWFQRFIRAPLRLRRTQTMALSPRFEQITADELTPEVRRRLGRLVAEFAAEGFVVAANLKLSGAVPGTGGSEVLLVNRQRRQVAGITSVAATATRNFVFVVRTRFADGSGIATGVNRNILGGPRDKETDSLSVPWVTDAATLCELHRRRLVKAGRADERGVIPAPGAEIDWMNQTNARMIDRHVRAGYRTLDTDAGVARYTLKGAYLSSWKLSPPITGFLIRRRDRRSARVWKELGMDRWTPQVLPAAAASGASSALASGAAVDPQSARPAGRTPVGPGPRLEYHAELQSGEVRWHWEGPVVTVTGKNRSPGETLVNKWFDVGLLLFYTLLFGFDGLLFFMHGFEFQWSTLFWVAIYLFFWRGLIKAVRRSGGTATVTAGPGYVRFASAPGIPRAGEIRTDEIAGLFMVRTNPTFGKSWTRLEARRHAAPAVVLLNSPDFPAVVTARQEILVATGIEHRQ